ncbi:MAG: FAD-dependent oxidoreductase [Pseudomonadota bacterium]
MLNRRRFLELVAAGSCVSQASGPAQAQGVGTDYDVIVIGGGIAGLVAAQRLVAAAEDIKVLLLEARDRVGGRVFSTALPDLLRDVDSGAAFLPPGEDGTEGDWPPARELGLKTSAMAPGRVIVHPGMSALVDGIAGAALGTLQLNSQVNQVFWREGLIGVNYRDRGLDSAVTTRRLVVTVPPPVLLSNAIEFTPPLPPEKLAAMREVVSTASLTFAAVFSAEDLNLTIEGDEWLQEDGNRTLRAFRAGIDGEILLEAQYRGSRAELLAAQRARLVRDVALQDFGDVIERIGGSGDPLWEKVMDWNKDEFSRGALFEVASDQARLGLADSIKDTLFFAGDCTDVTAPSADIASAYASGERVAQEVAYSLNLEIQGQDPNEPILELLL